MWLVTFFGKMKLLTSEGSVKEIMVSSYFLVQKFSDADGVSASMTIWAIST